MYKGKLPYDRFILPNGLRVILYPMSSVLSSFAVFFVKTGAMYEKERDEGISHFVEHATFLGTKKYPTPFDLSTAASSLGAFYDGVTSRIKTQYWVRLPSINLNSGLDFLYQLLYHPRLVPDDLEKEKGVILSEYNDYWFHPDRKFEHEVWCKRLSGDCQPHTHEVVGTPETIQSFSKRSVENWYQNYYHPKNMILSLAGHFHNDPQKKIREYFGQDKDGEISQEPRYKTGYSDYTFYYQKEDRPQIRFILTFPAFGWRERPRIAGLELGLFNNLFGGGPASRLFLRLREKERLVYRISSSFYLQSWLGDFEIWGSVPEEKLIPALKIIKEEIDKVLKDGLTEEEIIRGKKFLSLSTQMRFDNPESIAYFLANQEFDNEEIWLPQRYAFESEKIKKEDLERLAREIFDFRKINVCLMGKIKKRSLKETDKIFG